MKLWDLSAGAGKLELAIKSLQITSEEISKSWDDATYQRFIENYVKSVEPRIRTTLDALHRLSEVLSNAERQCRNE